jgi:Dehydrogenases (flavoproteins)
VLCFTGIAGGFSIVNVSLELELDDPHLSILTGSIPGLGNPSGVRLLDDFVAEHAWVGPKVFGGARPIPLAPPPPVVAEGRIALLGDAARQVFAGHGSGIGMQMIAARVLAESLAGGGTPWDYNVRFQRGWGGELAASVLFARYSTTLPLQDFTDALTSGLVPHSATQAALLQRPPRPALHELPALARGAIAHPRIVGGMLPILNKMSRCRRIWRRYPARRADLPGWLQRRAQVFGSEQ